MSEEIAAILSLPVRVLLSPGHPFFWLYLVTSAVIALAVCVGRSNEHGLRALRSAALEVFDPNIYRHRSAVADYVLVSINQVLRTVGVGVSFVNAETIAQWGASGLARLFGSSPHLEPGFLVGAAATLILALAADFAVFYFHVLQHRVPVLWELHKVHHSAEVLTPVTGLRMHPIAEILKLQFIAICVGLTGSVFLYLYAQSAMEITFLGINAVIFLWHALLGDLLTHTHVWIMLPRGLREIFYSPALHLIHHSADPKHAGKNLGFCFSLWDRLAGTLYEPDEKDRHALAFGIDPEDMRELRTVRQLYWTPVRNILFGRKRAANPAPEPGSAAEPVLQQAD
jgi:sterol desaturase/sphingolipid hydroxylase (fatty acid hydroxylase superfamily)